MKKIFIFFLAIFCCSCLSNTPSFKATNKYIETGTFTLITASYYGVSSWLAVNQSDFNINLITARAGGSPSYRAQVSLQDLNFDVTPSLELNISIEICSRYPTYLYVCLFSQRLNYLQALKARYIVLDQPIITRLRFFSLYREGAGITITNGSPNSADYTVSAINQAGTTKIFAILNGFNLTAPDANIKLDLKIAGSFVDSTTVSFQFSTTVSETIVINSIGFVYAGYNQADIEAWPFPAFRITLVSLSGSGSSAAVYTDSANVMKSYNTFWGLARFNVNNQPSIRFSSSLSGSTLQGGSAHPFNNIDFLAMIFQFKECASTTPYYMVATDICYDICPIRYYQDATVPYTCQLCINYDCKKCSSTGDCTSCSSTSDFRTLNSGTKRCDPLVGYYDDGTSNPIAQPCNNNCKACVNTAVECTSCKSGFLLNGGTKVCEACPNNCDICSTTAICTTCKIGFLRNNGTNLCQACPVYCDICSTTSVCTSCSQGYQLNLNYCVPQAKSLSTGTLVLIILIPVLLVSICLICLICYCCKRKRDNKIVQQQTIVNQPPIQINYEGKNIARQEKMINNSNISEQRNNRQDFMIQDMNDQSEVQIKLSQTIFHDKVKIRGQKTLY